MYLPKPPKKKRENPLRVQKAQNFLFASGMIGFVLLAISTVIALRRVQTREREELREQARKRPGKRVVIVGAGTGGAALAASLTNAAPELRVVVIEKEKTHTFHGAVPLAHVGHRSYDLNTTGGIDLLRSPATWNVTRDAQLVRGEVVEVRAKERVVVVERHLPEVTSTAVAATQEQQRAASAAEVAPAKSAARPWQLSYWGLARAPMAEVDEHRADGSVPLPNGLSAYPYDVLVVASGAQRGLGSLAPLITAEHLDRYHVAVSPGVTRDSLAQLFYGNVLHVKVPPASFVALTEKSRQSLPAPQRLILSQGGKWWADNAASAAVTDLLEKMDKESLSEEGPGCSTPTSSWAMSGAMHYAARQHDSTFISTTNMVWKYLSFFRKLPFCHLYTITADQQPIAPAPPSCNDTIQRFWLERQQRWRTGPRWQDSGFHFMPCSYVSGLDMDACVATLYNYRYNVELQVPFGLLLLDLPVHAPRFVHNSGLHRRSYEAESAASVKELRMVAETKQPTWRGWLRTASAASQPLLTQALTRSGRYFDAESSFMDVDPLTLQHRTHPNIFALGDVAGLPTVKGYGSTLAQVPIVTHNVMQVLENLKAAEAPAEGATASAEAPRKVNARYDGYSSFHVMMTTWRAMWPEMTYSAETRERLDEGVTKPLPLREPLIPTNHHLWDNLAWRDHRGLFNAVFYQWFLYEIVYFFAFTRGLWHPPTWFYVPTYSIADGTPSEPSAMGWL